MKTSMKKIRALRLSIMHARKNFGAIPDLGVFQPEDLTREYHTAIYAYYTALCDFGLVELD